MRTPSAHFTSSNSQSKFLFFIVASFCLIFQGCVAIGLMYKNAPYFVANRLSDDFDLTRAQTQQLKEKLNRFQDWHRSQEIPRYVRFLSDAKVKSENGISEKDVDWAMESLQSFRETFLTKILQDAPDFLMQLDRTQWASFEKSQAKSNEKRFSNFRKGREKYINKKQDQWQDRLEDWLGPLHQEQVVELRDFVETSFEIEKQRQDQILQNQRQFLSLGNTTLTTEELRSKLQNLAPRWHGTPQEKLQRQMLKKIFALASLKQLEAFSEEAGSWKKKLIQIGM
jgi:hypothetical protein